MSQHRWSALIKREKPLIITGFLLSIIMMVAYWVFFYTPTYQSDSKLYIRNIGNENILSTFGSSNPVKSESNYSNPLFNYQAILESERQATSLYTTLKKNYPNQLKALGVKSQDDWVDYYHNALTSSIVPSPDKKSPPAVRTALITSFKALNLDIQKSTVGQKSQQVQDQLNTITQELEAVRSKIKNYMQNNKAVDLGVESAQLTQSRVELQKDLEVIESDMAYNDQKLSELKTLLKFDNVSDALDAASVGEDPYLVKLNQDLADSQRKLDMLRSRFEDTYPDVKSALREVKTLEDKIKTRIKEVTRKNSVSRGVYNDVSNSFVQELATAKIQQKALQARRAELLNGIDRVQNNELSIPEKQRVLNELTKEEEALKTAYAQLKSSAMESRIKDETLIDNLFVLSAPSAASLVKKELAIQLFGLLLFGLFLGALAAYIKDTLQDQWLDIDEIEGLTQKVVLGNISWQPNPEDLEDGWSHEGSNLLREYTAATSGLIQRSYLEQAQVISFVSTANERKQSTVVRNLALNMALSQRHIILIDADFGAPMKHFIHETQHQPAHAPDILKLIQRFNEASRLNTPLTEHDVNQLLDECITRIKIPGTTGSLDYLSASAPVTRTFDYVASLGFGKLIEALKTRYEFVLVDTPAAPYHYPETEAVLRSAEGTVILAALHSSRNALLQTTRFLDKADIPALGVIARV